MDEENAYPEFLTVSKKREPVIFVAHSENPLLNKKNISLAEIGLKDFDIDMYSYYLCSRHRWMNPIMKEFIRIAEEKG